MAAAQSATGGNVSALKPDGLARLREPFGPAHVGKLPRITCPQCSNSSGRCCAEHSKRKCPECDNFITERHIHLDYVGHGAVTDRLLEVDPGWSWEPVAWDGDGFPAFICDKQLNPHAFWIRLTVLGVTRLGVGTCPAGQFDAEKVLIGDALRNAAMRFGVALDLWIKGHAEDDERTTATADRQGPDRQSSAPPDPTKVRATPDIVGEFHHLKDQLGDDQRAALKAWFHKEQVPAVSELASRAQVLSAIEKARELRSHTGPIDTQAEPADEEVAPS